MAETFGLTTEQLLVNRLVETLTHAWVYVWQLINSQNETSMELKKEPYRNHHVTRTLHVQM